MSRATTTEDLNEIETAIREAVRAVACRRTALIDEGSARTWQGVAEFCSGRAREALGRFVGGQQTVE